MKKLVLFLSILIAAPLLVPATAEARHGCSTRIIAYERCGAPIYEVREFIGYDHCGYPRYRVYTRSDCRCRPHHYHRPPCHVSHGHYYHPPRHYHSRSRGSISFYWSN